MRELDGRGRCEVRPTWFLEWVLCPGGLMTQSLLWTLTRDNLLLLARARVSGVVAVD